MATYQGLMRYRDATYPSAALFVESFNAIIAAMNGCGMVACTPAESPNDVGTFVESDAVAPDVTPTLPTNSGIKLIAYKTFKLPDSLAATSPLYVRVYFYWVKNGTSAGYVDLRFAASSDLSFIAPLTSGIQEHFAYTTGTSGPNTTALPTSYATLLAGCGDGYFWLTISPVHRLYAQPSHAYIPDDIGIGFGVFRARDANETLVADEALALWSTELHFLATSSGWASLYNYSAPVAIQSKVMTAGSWGPARYGTLGMANPEDYRIGGKTRLLRPHFWIGGNARRFDILVSNRMLALDLEVAELPFVGGVGRNFRHMRCWGPGEECYAQRSDSGYSTLLLPWEV